MTTASLFAPWLLTGELKPKKVEPVRQRLLEAFAGRPFPLHVNVLWNVLFWNWLPELSGYQHFTDEAQLEHRNSTTIEDALPVGAWVELERGDQQLWGEVVYKERSIAAPQPDLCSWEVNERALDPELKNEPVNELLVLDFETSLLQDQHALLDREMHREKLLDAYGHLNICARYEGADAGLDDAAFFVEYLLSRHGPALIREYSRMDLSEEQTRGALHQSLQSIRDILAITPGLRCWGDYWFTEDAFRAELGLDNGHDRIASIRKMIVRLPERHQPVGSHAVTLALWEYASRGATAAPGHALLSLTGHAARVCHTNAYLEQATRTASDSYVVRPIARRVDGGVWRSQRLGDGPKPAYLDLPPQMELPFGRSLPGASKERAAELLKSLTTEPQEPLVDFKVQRCDFRIALTGADIDEERLRIGRAAALLAGDTVGFRLTVPQTQQPLGYGPDARVDRGRGLLTGIDWLPPVYPGLIVHGTVQEGSVRLDAYVTPLANPVSVGSRQPLQWEFDPNVREAAVRVAKGLPLDVIKRAKNPAELLAAAFRRTGEFQEGGSYVASLSELYVSIVRAGVGQPPDLDFAQVLLTELIDSPLVTELSDGRFGYQPRVTKGVSSQDATTLAAWRDSEAGRSMRAAVYSAETWKRSFHLRKWEHKDHVDWEQRRIAFQQDAKSDHAYRFIKMKLPEGYTYVRTSAYHRHKNMT